VILLVTSLDTALLSVEEALEVLLPLGAEGLGVNEALKTLLKTLLRAEGLSAALVKLGGELSGVERGGAEVVAIHWRGVG
jgi:hypothetical protein